MPSKKPKDVGISQKEAEAIQDEMLNAPATVVEPPPAPEGPKGEVGTLEPPCFYAWDPKDSNCADCDGIDCVGEISETTGKCIAHFGGPGPAAHMNQLAGKAAWEKWYVAQANTNPPQTSTVSAETGSSLREKLVDDMQAAESETATIHAEIGVTEEIVKADGCKAWIKANFSEVRRLPEHGEADMAAEKGKLWQAVEDEVYAQIDRMKQSY